MRVLVVDDNAIIRVGLRQVLARLEEVTAVAEAADGQQAVEVVQDFEPDVVLLDVRMPVMDGLEALPLLADKTAVVMLTNDADTSTISTALGLGARGYLVHGSLGLEQVRSALATCREGGMVLAPEAAQVMLAGVPHSEPEPSPASNALLSLLTAREAEVLQAAAQGMSNAQIAAAQFLSPRTVKNYLNAAYVKLGVHNRAEAVLAWHEASAPTQAGRV